MNHQWLGRDILDLPPEIRRHLDRFVPGIRWVDIGGFYPDPCYGFKSGLLTLMDFIRPRFHEMWEFRSQGTTSLFFTTRDPMDAFQSPLEITHPDECLVAQLANAEGKVFVEVWEVHGSGRVSKHPGIPNFDFEIWHRREDITPVSHVSPEGGRGWKWPPNVSYGLRNPEWLQHPPEWFQGRMDLSILRWPDNQMGEEPSEADSDVSHLTELSDGIGTVSSGFITDSSFSSGAPIERGSPDRDWMDTSGSSQDADNEGLPSSSDSSLDSSRQW